MLPLHALHALYYILPVCVCVCVCYMDLVYISLTMCRCVCVRVRYSPHLLLTDNAQVHAEEMQLVHEEKVAAERLARQSERVALQQSLELETARTNNGTLAQVCTPSLIPTVLADFHTYG